MFMKFSFQVYPFIFEPHRQTEIYKKKVQVTKSNEKFILTSEKLSSNIGYIQIVTLRKEKDYGGKEKQY